MYQNISKLSNRIALTDELHEPVGAEDEVHSPRGAPNPICVLQMYAMDVNVAILQLIQQMHRKNTSIPATRSSSAPTGTSPFTVPIIPIVEKFYMEESRHNFQLK